MWRKRKICWVVSIIINYSLIVIFVVEDSNHDDDFFLFGPKINAKSLRNQIGQVRE